MTNTNKRERLGIDRRQALAGLGTGMGLAVMSTGSRKALAQAPELVLSNYGGQQVVTMKEAFTDPFTKETGIPVSYDTSGPNAGRIRAMMEGGKAVWDVCDSSPGVGFDLGEKGMLEEIDYTIVDPKKVPDSLAQKHSIGSYLFSSIITYNKRAFGRRTPQSWADFYNLKDFPGKRTLSRISQSVLETALMADGVPLGKIYPIDVNRALEKIKSIKGETLFWRTAAESIELMRSGEAVMGLLWSTRATTVKRDTKGDVDFTWNQGVLMSAAWVVPKGNPGGRTNAMKLIAFMQDPGRQATLLRSNFSGPINPAATALLTPDEVMLSPGAHRDKQLMLDYHWLAANNASVETRYIAAIS